MRIIFDVKDEPTNDVYVGQVRKDDYGVFAIVAKGESADKPFNAYLFTENVNDELYGELYGAINWREGTTADGIRAEFPSVVDAELILKGAK